jgi:hypothetical protein
MEHAYTHAISTALHIVASCYNRARTCISCRNSFNSNEVAGDHTVTYLGFFKNGDLTWLCASGQGA